ncbi:hypothetical protein CNR22_12570 [Sphingobacteriaceae bacterium]|nr:hypothetical protein CNR22_12570 [Sphingobacteriaceae bacterium]
MSHSEQNHTLKSEYFSTLDGFRGLAAIFILCFHSMFPIFSALWIGVPMFFVLSGFLITRILIQEKNSPDFLKTFYLKRALRIFPIYYLALLISVVWGMLVNADLSKLPLFLIYLQNFTISNNVLPDYCNGIMNHTWSLSSEEIFYVFWPLLILIIPTQKIRWLIIFIGVACLLYKIILLSFFYNEFTSQLLQLSLAGNLDALMAGSFLGFLSLEKAFFDQKYFPWKIFIPSICLLVAVVITNNIDFVNSKFLAIAKATLSVVAVVVSYFLIWFVSRENSTSFIHLVFRMRFLQFTGKISYGIYLYHALVFGITASCVYHFKLQVNAIPLFLFELLITYLMAVVSWYFIEKPILRLKNKFQYSKI